MFLAEIAVYIFLFTFILFMAYRVLWLVFFLFNFRFWEMIFEHYANGFMHTLTPIQKFLLLAFISVISYLAIYFTTIRMPLIRYILLVALFIAAIRVYSLKDIMLFKDYFQEAGMWSTQYWINQLHAIFSLKGTDVFSLFNKVIDNFVGFFMKIIEAVRKI